MKERMAASLLLALMIAPSSQAESEFHSPRTEAEQALDAILKRANADRHQLDNLFDGRRHKNFRRTFDYSTVLTNALIASMKVGEATLVRDTCEGVYTEEVCGMNSSPITCAQDYEYPYSYRSENRSSNDVTIAYALPGGDRPNATYRLVKLGKVWKIDGISCGYSNVKYNIK